MKRRTNKEKKKDDDDDNDILCMIMLRTSMCDENFEEEKQKRCWLGQTNEYTTRTRKRHCLYVTITITNYILL